MPLPPDPVSVLAAILRTAPTLTGTAVVTVIPDALTGPTVHLAPVTSNMRSPSVRGGPLVETATLAVTVWGGPDHTDARRLARRVLGVLLASRSLPVPGGVLVNVDHRSGPTFVPDPYAREAFHRYALTVAATVH